MSTMMECGCAAQGEDQKTGEPVCVVHMCRTPASKQPDFEGRVAKCGYGGHRPVPSSADLPFFVHRPEMEFDEYYCGCYGWN